MPMFRRRAAAASFVAALSCLALAFGVVGRAQTPPLYRDASRPVADRVADLVARMTLEEKVAQLEGIWQRRTEFQDATGHFDPAKAAGLLGQGIGEISRPSEWAGTPTGPRTRSAREEAEFINAVQHWVIDHTRLGIPVMFHEEAVHGLVAPGATVFPVPIGLASTWDPALLERVMSIAALEARSRGVQQVLAPIVDLARDPRWGRFEETYGEDPYLVSRLGVAAVRGYQGTTLPLAPEKVLATLKHFTGHGSHEGGINTAPSLIPERLLRSELFLPFEAAVKEAGAYAVMPSYNDLDGIPSHANRWLLEDVLRGEWHFRGVVVSDYDAIAQLASRHHVAADKADAARQAIEAGVDMELPDPDTFGSLVDLVKKGGVAESTIDTAVSHVLAAKFLAGLFEHPFADPDEAERVENTPEHQAVALEAAEKAIVLLENRNHTLPIDRSTIHTLAVIGPNAKGLHLGGYAGDPGRGVDVLTGITEAAGSGVRILYAEGVRITETPANWSQDQVTFGDPVKNRQRIQEAVGVARQADAIVLVVGTNESTSREAYSDTHLGDVADLRLMSQQPELVDAMLATGKPVIAVLVNGRPLAVPRLAEDAAAVLETWYLGQEGGTALGRVLFGDVNPGGKLPASFPRESGQLPVFYDRAPTSFRSYLDLTRAPLWAFGRGLSYTTFALSTPVVSPATIGPEGQATVTVNVTNTGTRTGDEVVQMYVHDVVSSVVRPVKELRGFERVTLDPGQTKTVTFTVGPRALSLIDRHMERVVEPGRFEILVGTSSDHLTPVPLEVVHP
jgi:beta-glucosidase